MIAYLLLSAGTAGTLAVAYSVAPAGRGLHRYVVPRSRLRADIGRLEREADDLTCTVIQLAGENTVLRKERDEASELAATGQEQILLLHEQLAAFDQLCLENTQLRAQLANATAYRPLTAADDQVSALPDQAQEYANTTATAWRARA
ncbi:hypothetical protein [Streptomyces sp. NPDC055058]